MAPPQTHPFPLLDELHPPSPLLEELQPLLTEARASRTPSVNSRIVKAGPTGSRCAMICSLRGAGDS